MHTHARTHANAHIETLRHLTRAKHYTEVRLKTCQTPAATQLTPTTTDMVVNGRVYGEIHADFMSHSTRRGNQLAVGIDLKQPERPFITMNVPNRDTLTRRGAASLNTTRSALAGNGLRCIANK